MYCVDLDQQTHMYFNLSLGLKLSTRFLSPDIPPQGRAAIDKTFPKSRSRTRSFSIVASFP